MSRRRRQSRAPYVVIVLLLVALGVTCVVLWRIYPEYRRLRAQAATSSHAPTETTPDVVPKPVVARLYFARVVEGKQRLVALNRELPAGLGPARAALEELIRGEVPRGCERPLPPGTSVLSVRVADGVATVDFSPELVSEFRGGSDNEGVTVYAIVNTLASLPTVDRVQILVEGKTANTIGGHLDVSQPLDFDDELVVEYP